MTIPEFPSPELLAARKRLLDAITAARKAKTAQSGRAPRRQEPQSSAASGQLPIDELVAAVEHYRGKWEAAMAEKTAVVASGTAGKVDGYWKAEHAARARYAASVAILGAFSEG